MENTVGNFSTCAWAKGFSFKTQTYLHTPPTLYHLTDCCCKQVKALELLTHSAETKENI